MIAPLNSGQINDIILFFTILAIKKLMTNDIRILVSMKCWCIIIRQGKSMTFPFLRFEFLLSSRHSFIASYEMESS